MRYMRGILDTNALSAEAGTPLRFVASTEGVARDGLVIGMDAWQLDNYRANPVVLWSHDYSGARPPIGRAEAVFVDNGRLMADIVFDQTDEFARSIEGKYRSGFLHTVSVGWETQAMEPSREPGVRGRVTRADLLDISAVPVPGDPNALISRQARALAELAAETESDSSESPASVGFLDAAAAMASLYLDTAQRPESEWSDDYRRLCRVYARFGKTPPEPLSPSTICVLGTEAVRGLFVEGEPEAFPLLFDARAGAVLSRENLADLTDAVGLIQRVISRGSKPGYSDEDEDDFPSMRSEPEPEPITPEQDNNDAATVAALTRILQSFGEKK